MATELLTVGQAAKFLGLSRQAIYLKIWSKEIRPVTLLGRMGIPLAVLEQEKKQRLKAKRAKKSNGNK